MEKLSTMETMNSLYDKAIAIRNSSRDYKITKVNPGNLQFNSYGGLDFISDEGETVSAALTSFALGQLGTKLHVPGQYIESCLNRGFYELAKDNVNAWIPDYSGGMFLRETDNHLRAVLSPRYSTYDSEKILDVIDSKVDFNEYGVKNAYISEERLHIRLTHNEHLKVDGEDLFPALFIDSSDVGRNTLVITFGIYKFICSNGLVIQSCGGTLYKQRHVGIDPEEFEYGIAAGLKNIPTLIENAEEWVKKARSEKITMDAMLAHLKAMKMGKKESDKVIDLMKTRYGMSKWGFINGITEVAQQYTLDKREELEQAAGKLLAA